MSIDFLAQSELRRFESLEIGSADITPRPEQFDVHGTLEDDKVKQLEYTCLV